MRALKALTLVLAALDSVLYLAHCGIQGIERGIEHLAKPTTPGEIGVQDVGAETTDADRFRLAQLEGLLAKLEALQKEQQRV